MKNKLRALRLREGDIVLVRDHETMEALTKITPLKGIVNCPIIFAPGSVHRLSKEYLRKLLGGESSCLCERHNCPVICPQEVKDV